MKLTTVLNGYVLLKPRAEEKPKTASGIEIEIPDSVDKERPTVGEVVLGNVVATEPFRRDKVVTGDLVELNAGMVVLFNAFAPRKVEHEGEECLLVQCEDIYAVIEA